MPSPLHELIVDLFRRDPTLASWLLREALGVDVPAGLVPVIAEPNFSELAPTEARTDLVVTFGRDGRTELVLIIEVQLRRVRSNSFPRYLPCSEARVGRFLATGAAPRAPQTQEGLVKAGGDPA